MSPKQIRYERAASRFMPRLWAFAYPMSGRSFPRLRRMALRAWAQAFHVRCTLRDDLR
jgi:hypothetical protein